MPNRFMQKPQKIRLIAMSLSKVSYVDRPEVTWYWQGGLVCAGGEPEVTWYWQGGLVCAGGEVTLLTDREVACLTSRVGTGWMKGRSPIKGRSRGLKTKRPWVDWQESHMSTGKKGHVLPRLQCQEGHLLPRVQCQEGHGLPRVSVKKVTCCHGFSVKKVTCCHVFSVKKVTCCPGFSVKKVTCCHGFSVKKVTCSVWRRSRVQC